MNKPLAFLLFTLVGAFSAFAEEPRTVTLTVTNMDCAACPITVRKALENVSGVSSAKVDFKTKRAVVAFDPAKATPQALTKATADAGFSSSVEQLR